MGILRRIFCFNNDDTIAIGLCKFNDDFFRINDSKERLKKKLKKDANLTQMLKRNI